MLLWRIAKNLLTEANKAERRRALGAARRQPSSAAVPDRDGGKGKTIRCLTRDGVDIVTVTELLGHSNIGVTMRYAHSNDDAKRRAVQRLKSSDKVVTVVPRRSKIAV